MCPPDNPQEISYEQLITEFTLPGKPGYKFKSFLDKLNSRLNIPKPICEEYNLETEEEKGDLVHEDEEERKVIYKLFKGGKMQLIPSFFKLIQELKKNKREFAVVFRSFGSDIENVVEEFNLFCQGGHPLYNGKNGTPRLRFDGKSKSKNMVIERQNQGYLSRTSEQESCLVLGTLSKHPKEEDPQEFHEGAIEEGLVSVFKDNIGIHVAIQERLQSAASIAIKDDLEYWSSNNYTSSSGKPLYVDPSDYSTLQVFFESKLGEEESQIVDVRDVVKGEEIPYKKSINKFLWRVDPYKAVAETNYFYHALQVCEEARNEEIRKLEAGETSQEEVVEETQSEWELLQSASTQDYLSRVIIPVLLPALQVVDIQRPQDPVSFMAHYILKHQDRVKLPAKPN